MTRVSGVPYEVDLPMAKASVSEQFGSVEELIAELERENFMLRARVQRLEEELANASRKP
jgi:hypothetical protein